VLDLGRDLCFSSMDDTEAVVREWLEGRFPNAWIKTNDRGESFGILMCGEEETCELFH